MTISDNSSFIMLVHILFPLVSGKVRPEQHNSVQSDTSSQSAQWRVRPRGCTAWHSIR